MRRCGALIVAALMALAGCATPATTLYYTLSSASPPPATAEKPRYRVSIGPVTVPEALDRSQIVLRVAPNRYVISEAERWSEPLKRAIPRLVAEEAGQSLRTARVAESLQHGAQDADYRILIDVTRFESAPGESIVLDAQWGVRNRSGALLRETRSVFVEKVEGPGIAPLVAAHRKALTALAREIAEAVDTLARTQR